MGGESRVHELGNGLCGLQESSLTSQVPSAQGPAIRPAVQGGSTVAKGSWALWLHYGQRA